MVEYYYDSDGTWSAWSGNFYENTTSSSCTNTYDVWPRWNSTAATTITGNDIWPVWNSGSVRWQVTRVSSMADVERNWRAWNLGHRRVEASITPEQLEAAAERRRAAEALRAERAQKERLEREAADARAEVLLLSVLTVEQGEEYRAKKQFHVTAPSGRRYCIRHGRQHNIFEVDAKGHEIKELCGHVGEGVPNADNILAQALALQTDEEGFLQVANVWDLTQDRRHVRTPRVAAGVAAGVAAAYPLEEANA